jgi:hypothetical protein
MSLISTAPLTGADIVLAVMNGNTPTANPNRMEKTVTHPHRLEPGYREALIADVSANSKRMIYDKDVDDGDTETGWKMFKDHNDALSTLLKARSIIQDRRIAELESEVSRLRIELDSFKAAAAEKRPTAPALEEWYQPNPLPRGMR